MKALLAIVAYVVLVVALGVVTALTARREAGDVDLLDEDL